MTLGQVVASQNSPFKKRFLYREGINNLPHSAPIVEKDGSPGGIGILRTCLLYTGRGVSRTKTGNQTGYIPDVKQLTIRRVEK